MKAVFLFAISVAAASIPAIAGAATTELSPFILTLPQSYNTEISKSITLALNRMVLIQNNDSGWDFYANSPDDLRDLTNATDSNQFGNNALCVLAGYKVAGQAMTLPALQKTAEYLTSQPIHRKVRLFADDSSFLYMAAELFGFHSYRDQAIANIHAEKDFSAAIYILGDPNATPDQVDAIPQAQIDAITNAQRVTGLESRFVNALGLNPALVIANWASRIYNAFTLGDNDYAIAIAAQIATDYAQVRIQDPSYMLGLASTIESLLPFAATQPAYAALIQDATTKLLAQQKTDGTFRVDATEGSAEGDLGDWGTILDTLSMLGQQTPMQRLLDAILPTQYSWGGYVDPAGGEYVAGEAAFLSALADVWTANFAPPSPGSMVPPGKGPAIHLLGPLSRFGKQKK